MTRFNSQKISTHQSYTIKEVSDLLDASGKTCLRWVGQGLRVVPGQKKPILVLGKDLKEFLRRKNTKHQVKLGRSEFYCLTCKGPRQAKRGSISISGNLKRGVCRVCSGKMTRTFKPSQKDYQIPSAPVQMSLLAVNQSNNQNDKSQL